MRKLVTGSVAALALAVTTIGAIAPAQAQWRGGGYGRGYGGGYGGGYGHYRRGGGRTGLALGAGALGLALGATIASGNRGYYGGGRTYYAPPPPPPPVDYYGDYGYGEPYAYGGYCRSDWRWDGYRGRYVRVQYCD